MRTHLMSLDIDNDPDPVHSELVRTEKNKVNELWTNIKNYFESLRKFSLEPSTLNENLLSASLASVKDLESNLVEVNIVERLPKRINPVSFFETLEKEVKKTCLWAQKQLFQCKRLQVTSYEKKLSDLKTDFVLNANEISNTETILKNIKELDLLNQLRDLKIFECLSAERASQRFLNIAKKTAPEASLNDLKNNGNPFESEKDREEHIVNFYSKLYDNDPSVQGEIIDFLGPEVAEHNLVKASKLTQQEKDELDSPLSIEELDKSLKKVNMKSAPGIDGYSYRFITKFWEFFRVPLFNCATECLENGQLPASFATAQIKLIPKKGATDNIRNWRPISLLSNFYKIISRLINNRHQFSTITYIDILQKLILRHNRHGFSTTLVMLYSQTRYY